MRQFPFLKGQLMLCSGSARDYVELARFHYLPKAPATFAAVWCVRYMPHADSVPSDEVNQSRLVAVGVLSYPVPCCKPRDVLLELSGLSYKEKLRFVNANLRRISRVIVHPQFRGIGLATMLIRKLCEVCPTRYVEASAAMGRVHPMFEKAGMKRIDLPEYPPYFWMDSIDHHTKSG